MIIIKEAVVLSKHTEEIRKSGKVIGFVPTMGALHEGHISLIKTSAPKCDITVCSIFVNPTQFNDPKDFQKYPITIKQDLSLLLKSNCDILFLPTVAEMYPEGVDAKIHYDLGDIENILEGEYRPGHFQGVCRVVEKLLKIVLPHYLYLGQKDYQQSLIIKQLIKLTALPVKIITVDTFRNSHGLAMSSRNLRLNELQMNKATIIYKMLRYIKENCALIALGDLERKVSEELVNNGFEKVDYVCIADAETLQPVKAYSKSKQLVALIAAFIGGVRLIDNLMLQD